MSERSTEALVSAYLSDRAWDDRREAVVKTSDIVRETASALLESGVVGTQELTALYRLCMNDSTYPVSSKRSEIDELAIPEETKTSLKNRVDESVGTVGGLLFPVEVPDDVEDAVTECLDQLLAADDGEQLDDAVRRLASVDLPNVE
ncbi:hypothetical protein [Halobellus marinus]|uniref:hypothetical protein n=1 Tax=Halobellus TaxID=1073986 RepID=UPI0028AE5ADA|nr:hypothetical protein [Halobellus sp. DFY28]